eukprot:3961591-Prymnesium_polylepis.1
MARRIAEGVIAEASSQTARTPAWRSRGRPATHAWPRRVCCASPTRAPWPMADVVARGGIGRLR